MENTIDTSDNHRYLPVPEPYLYDVDDRCNFEVYKSCVASLYKAVLTRLASSGTEAVWQPSLGAFSLASYRWREGDGVMGPVKSQASALRCLELTCDLHRIVSGDPKPRRSSPAET
ncbi:hypothetical protein E2C01_032905 [Portunus trituberculatus]|uniref:Uncharacterized protein n=1 Tax=Portunus trituberculatus TaxID=210409 RepID=A0A5B7EWG1_PORTR|nr:hypothetical protein [Portunus trituberculatus]